MERSFEDCSLEISAAVRKFQQKPCEYCGCTHPVRGRLSYDGYVTLHHDRDACHQYIRDIMNEIMALKTRLGLPTDRI